MVQNRTRTRPNADLAVIESDASSEYRPSGGITVKKQVKFGIGIGVIVVAMGFLAWLGYGESKTYYHTIAELQTLQGRALKQRMRVGGTVAPNSIHRYSGRVDFVLEGEGKTLPVSYVGSDPLPDTFVDKAQALVEGSPSSDGRFVAEHVQAKCASKYEAAPGGTGGAAASPTQRSGT
jgi:cytochrome c-type biogenesis protein CcmE